MKIKYIRSSRTIRVLCVGFLMFFSHVSAEETLFWWGEGAELTNFGDYISRVIVERILGHPVKHSHLDTKEKTLLAAGSILHFARPNDVVWGSGFRENPNPENRDYRNVDIRAVRGPIARDFLLKMGANCPEVYGDPAVLMGILFPEFKTDEEPIYDYIIIPNKGEMKAFASYKNVVLPVEAWEHVVAKIVRSRLVISSSLHGLIVAEAYGIPARLLKMTWIESLLKYQDYYASTSRPNFSYATSVQQALEMGGEEPARIDTDLLLKSFPYDYWEQ